MTTYYVAKTGSNSNDGSSGSPWLTGSYAISQVSAGDVIEIKDSGTYIERLIINKPITIQAATGQTPIISGGWDGNFPVPPTGVYPGGNHYDGNQTGVYLALVHIQADDVTIDGLIVEFSTGRGIDAYNVSNVTIKRCTVRNVYSHGINLHTCTNSLTDYCTIYNSGLLRLDDQNPTGGNWPTILVSLYTTDHIIRNCVVHDNHGEGIVAGRGSLRCVIEDNKSYNNRGPQLYCQRANQPTIRRCVAFTTSDYIYGPQTGIVIANEDQIGSTFGTGYKIYNNLVVNCRHGFAFWQIDGGGLVDALIEHNTFVNALTHVGDGKIGYTLKVDSSTQHSNSHIRNNIFYQTINTNGEIIASVVGDPGVIFDHNCFYGQTPDPDAVGTGDVTGNPLLVNPISLSTPADFVASNYALQSGSPCINAGNTATAVTEDFNTNARDANPDIGAFESGSAPPEPPPPSSGNVQLDGTIPPYSTSTTETTTTHTFTLNATVDKIIVIIRRVWWYTNSPTINSITYNGVALSLIHASNIEVEGSYHHQVHAYELTNPATGNPHDLVISYSAAVAGSFVSIVPLTGAESSSGTAFTGTSQTPSGTIQATANNSIIIGGFMHRGHDADPFTPDAGVTELIDGDTGGTSGVSDFGAWEGYIGSTTSNDNYTIGATASDVDLWIGIVLEVTPAAQGYTATAQLSATPLNGPAPLTVAFTDTSETTDPGEITSRSLEYDNGSGWVEFSTVQSPNYTFNDVGVYSIRLTVTTANGATDTLTLVDYITVTAPTYTVTSYFDAYNVNGPTPLRVTFATNCSTTDLNGIALLQLEYDSGSGWTTFHSEANPIPFFVLDYYFVVAGTYSVRLTATSASGATATFTRTNLITVTASPPITSDPNIDKSKHRLTVQITDGPKGRIIEDYTALIGNIASFDTGPHGFDVLTIDVILGLKTAPLHAARIYKKHVSINAGPVTVYSGRVDDITITSQGLKISAYGDWIAMTDVRYTATWIDTSIKSWQPLNTDVKAENQKYEISIRGSIYMAPTKDETFTVFNDQAFVYVEVPHGSTRPITRLRMHYKFKSSADWRFVIQRRDDDLNWLSSPITLYGDDSELEDDIDLFLEPAHAISISLQPLADLTYTGDTGWTYLVINDVRVQTIDTDDVTIDQIARDLVAHTRLSNPDQLASSTAQIQTDNNPLHQQVFKDMTPAKILEEITPQNWRAAIWTDQILYLVNNTEPREWFTEINETVQITITDDDHATDAYGVYEAPSGRELRTANTTDIARLSLTGIHRQIAAKSKTTDLTEAEKYRDDELNAAKTHIETNITLTGLFDENGKRHELWELHSGDRLTIWNIPPALERVLQGLESFIVERTTYDMLSDTLRPKAQVDRSIEFLISQ
ncbi:MAG: right-handed parallel beta-helix repeat-containing protein [Anaerolineales bacterium]|nr:right-handed parallel beta-helix repeat-containing protein [Anaerolineales bacterium]